MIYTYRGSWSSRQTTYNLILLPLTGHISTLDTPKEFGWGKVPPITIVQDPNALKIIYKTIYKKIIGTIAKQVDELWIATDPDSEGDNIGYEAYLLAIKANSKLKTNVRRIWNSSLTKTEIQRAVLEAESKNYGWDTNLALSVQGRRLTDAWLGFSGTRELTGAARKVKPVKVVSVGRVQLPTLKIIVDRDLEHENHIPQDLWNIIAELNKLVNKNNPKSKFLAKHYLSPLKEESKALEIYDRIKNENEATIEMIKKSTLKKSAPIPLNTTAAISLLSRIYKLKADFVLNILATLYLEGLLSYPRTENSYFKPDFPHNDILTKLQHIPRYKSYIDNLESLDRIRTNGKKKGVEDHDPIHPTGEIPKGENTNIQDIHLKVLETLTRYYIAMFMPDLVTEKTKVDININIEKFISEGNVIIDKGWTEICPWVSPAPTELPFLSNGEKLQINKLTKIKSQTRPKPRWKEFNIIKQMERLRLGTKSSRPEILKVLAERNYVIRNKANELISTPMGRTLINILKPIWPDIVTPTFTRHVEEQMTLVAQGNKPYQELITDLRSKYLSAHQELLKNINQFQTLLKEVDMELFSSSKYKQYNKTNTKRVTPKHSKSDTKTKKSHGPEVICPKCDNGQLIKRTNSQTKESFYGCNAYPNCKYTSPISKSASNKQSKKTTKKSLKKNHNTDKRNISAPIIQENTKCPLCKTGNQLIRINNKTGDKFYGCNNYPSCKWTKSIN